MAEPRELESLMASATDLAFSVGGEREREEFVSLALLMMAHCTGAVGGGGIASDGPNRRFVMGLENMGMYQRRCPARQLLRLRWRRVELLQRQCPARYR